MMQGSIGSIYAWSIFNNPLTRVSTGCTFVVPPPFLCLLRNCAVRNNERRLRLIQATGGAKGPVGTDKTARLHWLCVVLRRTWESLPSPPRTGALLTLSQSSPPQLLVLAQPSGLVQSTSKRYSLLRCKNPSHSFFSVDPRRFLLRVDVCAHTYECEQEGERPNWLAPIQRTTLCCLWLITAPFLSLISDWPTPICRHGCDVLGLWPWLYVLVV